MNIRKYISVLILCLAIGSLGFTTLFFYDYNFKIVMVEEVQEKNNEDVYDAEQDYELNSLHHWDEWLSQNRAVHFIHDHGLFAHANDPTNPGYFLELIKPPIH